MSDYYTLIIYKPSYYDSNIDLYHDSELIIDADVSENLLKHYIKNSFESYYQIHSGIYTNFYVKPLLSILKGSELIIENNKIYECGFSESHSECPKFLELLKDIEKPFKEEKEKYDKSRREKDVINTKRVRLELFEKLKKEFENEK